LKTQIHWIPAFAEIDYILYHGYRDGWLGLQLALNMAIYKMLVCAKMMELDRIGQYIQVEDVYSNQAKKIIADYET
jgi:hypothetical protein